MSRFANREEYEAWKRGEAVTPGSVAAVASPSAAPSAAPRPVATPAAKPKTGLKETFSGLPPWAWIFVVACMALPVVNLGGAIPTGLGFGGATACANVAKKKDWELAPRALVCGLITGGIWIVFFGVAIALVSLQK